tara:strand:+ start:51470 stop:51775 length:306 start_codon:yes stop_codon:yes gene_type:complete
MTDIIHAIKALKSDAQVTVDNDDINKITWHDGNPTNITNKQITDKQKELQTTYDNNKYQRDRAVAYPSIKDQLDMQYWDKVNSTTTWQDAIAKIKSDNPKG